MLYKSASRRSALLSLLLTSSIATATAVDGETRRDLFGIEVVGSGPDLLLLPGLGSSPEVWSSLVSRLSSRYRIHLVSVAGFAGRAPLSTSGPLLSNLVDGLADYIQHQGLSNPTVIGHSMGGEIGLMLAARHPKTVGQLVVVDALPFYSLLFSPSATVESVAPGARAFRNAWLAATDEQLKAMQEASAARLATGARSQALISEWGMRSDHKTVAQAAYELATTDLRPELPKIQAPTTVVYAYNPVIGSVELARNLFASAYRGLPGVTFVQIDNSRHFVMLDQADAFNEAVAKALL